MPNRLIVSDTNNGKDFLDPEVPWSSRKIGERFRRVLFDPGSSDAVTAPTRRTPLSSISS